MAYRDPEVGRARDRERFQRRTAERIAHGLCPNCGRLPPEPGRSLCEPCGEKRRAAGLCGHCGERTFDGDARCGPCAERKGWRDPEKKNAAARRLYAKRRARGQCADCGQSAQGAARCWRPSRTAPRWSSTIRITARSGSARWRPGTRRLAACGWSFRVRRLWRGRRASRPGRSTAMPGATCTLTATVHSERNLGGDVLQTLSVSFTVTASFEALPSEHDSESVFIFNVRFSEALASKRAAVRSAFTVTGGSVTGQMRVNGQSDLWRIKIRPSSHGDVSIALPANVACNAGGLCTADGDVLSNAPSATVQGLVALSVADARVHEAANATLDFAVSLSRAASGR